MVGGGVMDAESLETSKLYSRGSGALKCLGMLGFD